MRYPSRSWLFCVIFAFATPIACSLQAKTEEWQDTQGAKFKGEAVEVLGPFAVFATGRATGRRVFLNMLSDEDCVRFYEQTKALPQRASDWGKAKSDVSSELIGNVLKLENEKLVPADLNGRSEPEVFIVFFASNGEGGSWALLGETIMPYFEIQKAQPGMLEALFFGLRHSRADHSAMAKTMKVPWLVTDLLSQSSLSTVSKFAPGEGFGAVALTRMGIPLFAAANPKSEEIKQFMIQTRAFIDLLNPDNPKTWQARAHYLQAIQRKVFATGKSDPVLVGNPLREQGLRQRKVFRFDAVIKIGADSRATEVTFKPGADMPEAMAAPLAEALKQAMFVAAVDNGTFVEGEYLYHFEIAK
jgi:hypothetical protein